MDVDPSDAILLRLRPNWPRQGTEGPSRDRFQDATRPPHPTLFSPTETGPVAATTPALTTSMVAGGARKQAPNQASPRPIQVPSLAILVTNLVDERMAAIVVETTRYPRNANHLPGMTSSSGLNLPRPFCHHLLTEQLP
ncbi:hypothetical protein L13192_04562 [Pyrenophora tritici-repentis]|nr:hypothetical protein Ptr86124_005120 [Pyrenophora tritici-repentis]KAI1671205.1 hypothetical protein L13192_04562 [Pyrenophora tritici-repentis]KAI1685018.1 hypothetical protein KJE20_05302 [Pyrenophora tritici-repentis]